MNRINIVQNYLKTQATGAVSSMRHKRDIIQVNNIDKPVVSNLFSYRWWKDIIDPIISAFIILILSPLMVLIAIVIKFDSPGSAIYRREQVGKNGKVFKLYKFRSMYLNNDQSKYKSYITKYILEDAPYTTDENGQPVYKVIDDDRVTRVGAWIRKTNLDELPQFFNVLKGDISIIGPRPDIPFAVDMYDDWHRQRFQIKPGITGLWQVSERKCLSFNDMVRLDIEYINKQSLLLDVKISLLTVAIILKRDGS
jgi:lipopolysaccharide/colanic/teichoic acid biosynthesis glycosyltransferase